jgi:hypothetical protein
MPLGKILTIFCMMVGAAAVPAFAKTTDDLGQGQAIVTVLPLESHETPVNISQNQLRATVNGRSSDIIDWKPLNGSNSNLELVIMIDGSTHAGIGLLFDDLAGFIRGLPADAKVAVGYMDAGRTVLRGGLSTDRAGAIDALRIPAGAAGSNASPYFCLSDLAKKWPSDDARARREVIMITDGVDNYYPGYSPDDPYLKASIRDAIMARLVVFSIYMPNRGQMDGYASSVGQSLLTDVTGATGGYTYWDGGSRNPVSLRPYLDDIAQRLQNQYQLRFQSRLKGKTDLQRMSLKVLDGDMVEVFAPRRVHVSAAGQE